MSRAITSPFVVGPRLMLIAPHPDDESLACSVILQQAVRRKVAVCVVYITDGDDNPWPQRVCERKWRLSAADRKRWGKLRRAEALAALRVLGLRDSDAQFLGFPDQGLTNLLLHPRNAVLAQLAGLVADWNATDVLAPSPLDTHPDHNAVAVMLRLIFGRHLRNAVAVRQWSYLVHGRSAAFSHSAIAVRQSEKETVRKRSAILCHKTQIKLSKRRFLGYATCPERLAGPESNEKAPEADPISAVCRHDSMLSFALRSKFKPFSSQENTILVLGRSSQGEVRSFNIRVPVRSDVVEILDGTTQETVGFAHYQGDAFAGEMILPTTMFSSSDSVFLKLGRRSWFFDEMGWLEVLPAPSTEQLAAQRPQMERMPIASR